VREKEGGGGERLSTQAAFQGKGKREIDFRLDNDDGSSFPEGKKKERGGERKLKNHLDIREGRMRGEKKKKNLCPLTTHQRRLPALPSSSPLRGKKSSP